MNGTETNCKSGNDINDMSYVYVLIFIDQVKYSLMLQWGLS